MLDSRKRICIIDTGAFTPIGLTAESSAAAVRAGLSGMREHTYMINRDGEPYVLATVPSLDPSLMGVQRYLELVRPALEQSVRLLPKDLPGGPSLSMIIALPEKKPGVPEDLADGLAGFIRGEFRDRCQDVDIRFAHNGHAAALIALQAAGQLLSQEKCQFCVAGGVDTYHDPETLDWVEENDQLHVPSNAWGFIPGEGSAFCLLCTYETAGRFRLPIRAQVLSANTTKEENRIKTETICVGTGLTEAVSGALEQLSNDIRIDQTYCDQNGEAYRADEYGFMLARLSEYFVDPSEFTAPADCWGDVGAASGAMFANLAVQAAARDYSRGPISLLWASSEGGERSALVLNTKKRAVL